MADCAQRMGQIAYPGPHVSAFATTDFELGMVRIGHGEKAGCDHFDRAGLEHHFLALPGQVIGSLALNLDGGVGRRHLDKRAGEAGKRRFDLCFRRPAL